MAGNNVGGPIWAHMGLGILDNGDERPRKSSARLSADSCLGCQSSCASCPKITQRWRSLRKKNQKPKRRR